MNVTERRYAVKIQHDKHTPDPIGTVGTILWDYC